MTDSMEAYLKTILQLSAEKPYVRAVDIAKRMGYSKPSVHRAIGLLLDEGYISIENGKQIVLSAKGRSLAEEALHKRSFFFKLLIGAGITEEAAEEEASKMSQAISSETFLALQEALGK